MRAHSLTLVLALAMLSACQSVPAPEPLEDYATLAERARSGEERAPAQLREAFLRSQDFNERMQELTPLERQAVDMLEADPLRLGAIGSAITDRYYGSLIGHYALSRFYRHVGAADEQKKHDRWVREITEAIESGADGTERSPYPVISANEARVFLRIRDLTPAGSMYYSTDETPFMVLVATQPQHGALRNVYFDLTGPYHAVSSHLRDEASEDDEPVGPGVLIGYLAQQNDPAAQASLGSYLYAQGRDEEAARWFSAAARHGNVLANLMLGQIYQREAREREGEERRRALDRALDNYMSAIAMGSDEAMFTLGALYVDGRYGEENIDSGVALLRQAAAFDNPSALLVLARLYEAGEQVERDPDEAEALFHRAAELGSARARIQYARFLLSESDERPFDARALDWLRELAAQDNARAMLLLGNLYAKGIGVSRNYSRSVDWFKAAADAEPDDASIVNQVAWTLTVSHLPRLRRPAFALEIMERIMQADEDARRNPAFLDTWAAAYAANGDFDRALDVQQDALHAAREHGSEDIVEILEEHLESFKQGETLTDEIP